jgi:Cu(I)/Ag(I) efflux system membrane fusion protein
MNSLNQRALLLAASAVLLSSVSALIGYRLGGRENNPAAGDASASVPTPDRRVLYWYDPMQPAQHFDKPGKSPFMDMQLIPKYAAQLLDSEGNGIRIDSSMSQNLGIRLATVEHGPLTRRVAAVGSISFDQRDLAVIQARSSGFVTRVYSRAPGDVIQKNDSIVDLLMPEWTGAQTEFIALLGSGDRVLIDAARQRMILLGMPVELIAAVERTRQPQASVTIRSPLAGVIATLDARAGMSMSSGATIASINGLSTVWLEAGIPQARGMDIAIGHDVTARLTAFPGETFRGRVIAVLPQASAETRTLRVRIEMANPSGRLKPGMYAEVGLQGEEAKPVVFVASEVLIRTGTRTVAIVAEAGGRYVPTVVDAGPEIDGNTVVLRGLEPGQRVVASGQFLIDSEANLRGALARLGSGGDMESTADDGQEPRR